MNILCLIGIHNIKNRYKDECYVYKHCDKCQTLFVDYRWKYIWTLLFGNIDKMKDMEDNSMLNKILNKKKY
jgi:hypothetical protein